MVMDQQKEILVKHVQEAMDWGYEKSLNGLPGLSSASELADNYLQKHHTTDKAINSLIRYQDAKAGTSGFLTGIGGLITLPVSIPANITSVLYVQIRMIAAIAHMRGYDLKDDQVKTFVYVALTGKSASGLLKKAGIELGEKLATKSIQKIPMSTIHAINRKVGYRMVTRFGRTGTVNLGKLVPLAGGVVGGTADTIATHVIGKTAKKMFVDVRPSFDEPIINTQ